MSNATQVVPGFWKLTLGSVNSYLLETEDGLMVIDSGYPKKVDLFLEAVREAGYDPKAIRHLIVTHGHVDHAGGAAEIARLTGAKTYAHPKDLELIGKGVSARPGTAVSPGLKNWLVYTLFIRFGGTTYEPFKVDKLVNDGEILPLAGGIKVILAPGHCAGQVALLLQQKGILIAADICSNVGGLGYSIIHEDIAQARHTILKIAALPFDTAVFGHGDPVVGNANQKLKDRFTTPKLK